MNFNINAEDMASIAFGKQIEQTRMLLSKLEPAIEQAARAGRVDIDIFMNSNNDILFNSATYVINREEFLGILRSKQFVIEEISQNGFKHYKICW